tara:strand:- start:17947 stop:19623 length:1677 start_codon:yes stop_codon:yes gene_type:complete
MANYIGYDPEIGVEQVDWGTITSDLVDGIKKEDERRVQKKADIEKGTTDLITEIRDHQSAIGSNTTYNGYVLDASQQAIDYTLMQQRLLKKGQLKPSDIVKGNQVLSDDWKSFEQISKTFQDQDAAAKKAQSEGLSLLGEESFAKFQQDVDINNSRLVVNPEDGRLYFETNDKRLLGMSSINNRAADLPKDFDILAGTKGFTDTLGRVVGRDGMGGTIENIRDLDSFKKSKKSYIESINADPRNTLSILTQNGYKITQNPDEADANTILVKPDENGMLQPDLSDANIKASNGFIDEIIDSQLNKIYSAKSSTGSGDLDKERNLGQQYGYVANIFNPDEGMRKESINKLLQNFPNVEDITVDNKGVTITKNDGTSPAIPIDFIRSGEGATEKYNTAEQMADQLISALTGATSAEKLKKYKDQFKQTGEYQKMKDNFDKALNANSISVLESSTSRPLASIEFTEKQLSEFAKTLDIDNLTAITKGTGQAVVGVFNNFLLANQRKAKNARLKIDDSGNIVLSIGNKDISLGNETKLNTNDIARTIQLEVANFKPNSMSNFN